MLDETTYPLYNKYLEYLMIKFQYDAVVNLYGNGYAGEISNEFIKKANPFNNLKPQKDRKIKNTNSLQQLQMMGIDVNIHKDGNFKPISKMLSNTE